MYLLKVHIHDITQFAPKGEMMISKNEDAYGKEIWDFLKGDRTLEIVERDDGYIDVSSGALHYFSPIKAWPKDEQAGMRYVKGRVLDIGCGAGRVLHQLEKKGHDVLGIDISPGAIKTCHELGFKNTKVLSITQISSQLGQFDTIVMYGNNFGLFGSFKRARWLLKKMHKMTSDKARIIASTTDPHQTNMPEHKAYHKFNRSRGRMPGQLRIRVRYKKSCSRYFDYLLVSPNEMKKILKGTGWKTGTILPSDGPQYVAVIEKI